MSCSSYLNHTMPSHISGGNYIFRELHLACSSLIVYVMHYHLVAVATLKWLLVNWSGF